MIKINFLSSFKDSSGGAQSPAFFDADERKQITIAIAIRLGLLALGPVGMSLYEGFNMPILHAEREQAEKDYDELKRFNDSKQGSAEEILKYEDEDARFKAQMDFINKIQADKLNEYKLFRHLKESTPPTVWVDNLSLTENILQITGQSLQAGDIAQFQDKLANSDFIVSLVPLDQKTTENAFEVGIPVTSFQVKATLRTGGSK
jgi:Tfp pilus assembly protein PilN